MDGMVLHAGDRVFLTWTQTGDGAVDARLRVERAEPVHAQVVRDVYPELVRARRALGWDPERAATTPVAPKARLTKERAEHVRTSEASAEDLARELGISPRHVRRIRAGRAWKRTTR